jgi:hypothetical protein
VGSPRAANPPTSLLTSDASEPAECKNKGWRFGWSEAGWWAWEDLNLRPHPETKIARVPMGSAAPRAELGRAHRFSSLVAAPAMAVLSAIGGLPLCNPAFLQVMRDRKGRSNALFERVSTGQSTLGSKSVAGTRATPIATVSSPRMGC